MLVQANKTEIIILTQGLALYNISFLISKKKEQEKRNLKNYLIS